MGWNCEMSSAELRVPRIAMGLVESWTDNDWVARERRGLKEFSIMAQNWVGDETFRFSANNRISCFNRMMDSDRVIPTSLLHQSTTGGIGWPIVLAIVIAVVGIVTIGITLQCYKKKHGLSWNFCNKEDDMDTKEMEEVTIDPLGPAVRS